MKVAARFAHLNGYHPANTPEALAAKLGIHPAEVLKLDANENPFGPSPQARRALAQLDLPHRYPDASYAALRTTLADFCDAPAELIQVGAGADELIDFTLRCLLEPGEIVLNLPPTFSMYPIFTGLNGGKVVSIPRLPGFRLDLPAIRQAVARHAPKALFLAAPNNPDGSLPDAAEIDALLELPTLTILDEAYVEFSDGNLGRSVTRIGEVAQRNNLVVLRTFSKWAGLAGLRFGYGAFPGVVGDGDGKRAPTL
jgi:histidinol-phosphate aminotransferase